MILIADHYSLPDYSVFILNEAIHKYRNRFNENDFKQLKLLQQELDELFVNQHNSIHIFK